MEKRAAQDEGEEQVFRDIFEHLPIGIYKTTPQGKILMVNPSLLRMLHYDSFEEIKNRDLEKEGYHPDYSREYFRKLLEESGEVRGLESAWITKDKKNIYVRENARVVYGEGGEILYYIGIVEDITERKLLEQKIQQSLKEKETLLKEIHHRVKNNMQTITSLLDLQAGMAKNEQLAAILSDSRSRIKSMALIHEMLYHTEDMTRINVNGYVRRLIDYLLQSAKVNVNQIDFKMNIEEIEFNIDTAIPCGLIINELITNSLKYAVSDYHDEVKIFIGIFSIGDSYEMIIEDNGVGLPEDIDIKNPQTLGLQLVVLFVQQLRGIIEMERRKGTTFKITFPKMKY